MKKAVPRNSGLRVFIIKYSIALLPVFSFAKHAIVSLCVNLLVDDFTFLSYSKFL